MHSQQAQHSVDCNLRTTLLYAMQLKADLLLLVTSRLLLGGKHHVSYHPTYDEAHLKSKLYFHSAEVLVLEVECLERHASLSQMQIVQQRWVYPVAFVFANTTLTAVHHNTNYARVDDRIMEWFHRLDSKRCGTD